jgi:hypothetical protein
MSATISNCTGPLGEATQEGLYLHAVFSFLFVLGCHVCYKWMSCERDVLQSSIPEVPATAAAQTPFLSDPKQAKCMAEAAQAARAQMAAKNAMAPHTCWALWVD